MLIRAAAGPEVNFAMGGTKKAPKPAATDAGGTKKAPKRAATDAGGTDHEAKPSKKPRSDAPQSTNDRTQRIMRSHKKNPANVFVIGPPSDNWVDNAASLAGYLGIKGSLEGFRQYLLGKGDPPGPSKLTHGILENYNQIRLNGYGKAVGTGKETVGGTKNASVTQIWLALNDMDGNYRELISPHVNLPLPPNSKFPPGSSSYVIAVNIAAMSFLIHHNPQFFPASHAPLKDRKYCVGLTNIPAEDWHRALWLVKFYTRQTSDVKKENGFLTKDRSNQQAKAVDYFTPEDVEDFEKEEIEEAEGDLDGRTPGDAIDEAYEELADKEDPPPPPLDTTVGLTDFVESTIEEWETAIEVVDKNLRRRDAPLGSAGRTVKRVRMTKTQLRQACERIGEKVKVKHDDPSMGDMLTAQEKSLEDASRQEGRQAQVRLQTIVWVRRPGCPSDYSLSIPLQLWHANSEP
jgi:hypothetical protein